MTTWTIDKLSDAYVSIGAIAILGLAAVGSIAWRSLTAGVERADCRECIERFQRTKDRTV